VSRSSSGLKGSIRLSIRAFSSSICGLSARLLPTEADRNEEAGGVM
jgi:hypothetical protein